MKKILFVLLLATTAYAADQKKFNPLARDGFDIYQPDTYSYRIKTSTDVVFTGTGGVTWADGTRQATAASGDAVLAGTQTFTGSNYFTAPYFGIGTTNPSYGFEVKNRLVLFSSEEGAGNLIFQNASKSTDSSWRFQKSSGTMSSPVDVKRGQKLLSITAEGYAGSGYNEGAVIEAVAEENFSYEYVPPHALAGTSLRFYTTNISSNVPLERMRIGAAGDVVCNSTFTAKNVITTGEANEGLRITAKKRPTNGCVVFTYDDGYASVFSTVAPQFTSRGVKGTSFITISLLESAATYMTWAQVLTLQAQGWEIGSHSLNHVSLSAANAEEQLSRSYNILVTSGVAVKTLAYPYGSQTNDIRAVARKYYTGARATVEDPYVYFPIKRYEVAAHLCENLASSNTYVAAISSAATYGTIVVFYAHDISPALAVMHGYLIDQAQARGVAVKTFYEALNEYGNTLETIYLTRGDTTATAPDGTQLGNFREFQIVDPRTTGYFWAGWSATSGRWKFQTYGSNLELNPEGNSIFFTSPFNCTKAFWINAFQAKSVDYTASATTDYNIFVTATSGNRIISLPSATSQGYIVNIQKVDSSTNTVTISPYLTNTIEGQSSYVLRNQYDGVMLHAYWDTWRILSRSYGNNVISSNAARFTETNYAVGVTTPSATDIMFIKNGNIYISTGTSNAWDWLTK